jgi:tRNA dimethylallyltransferase
MEPSVWLIAGPTASGKSELALRLAEAIGGEIVNADSMQLYAGLRVLTARPSPEDVVRATHHLYGVADAAEAWSVGRWLRAATQALADVFVQDRPAIVVGGTGLYFKALTEGLADIPDVPSDVREAMRARYETLGEAAFRTELRVLDPQSEARIAPGDRQRLVRAREVVEASGRALAAWQAEAAAAIPTRSWRAVVLEPPRPALYARCDARVEGMVAQGALEEVRALLARGLPLDLPAMKAIGVREFGEYLAGRIDLSTAIAAARLQTRRYAKRQSTWFRHQAPGWQRIGAETGEARWTELKALAGPLGA